MLAGLVLQQFHQAAHRPATAGKLCIQYGVPGRKGRIIGLGKGLRLPDMGQLGRRDKAQGGKGRHGNPER